jgi:hypothetical protein
MIRRALAAMPKGAIDHRPTEAGIAVDRGLAEVDQAGSPGAAHGTREATDARRSLGFARNALSRKS